MELKDIRTQIDKIDDEIIASFKERMTLCCDVAKYKKDTGMQIYNPQREREIIARLTKDMDDSMASYTKVLYTTIFEASRSYQAQMLGGRGELVENIQKAIEETPKTLPQSGAVACQGVEGSNSQIACEKLFQRPSIMYMASFEGVFNAVQSGLCKYGLLPIENNLYGSVTDVYDLMKKYKFYIATSIKMRITHTLLAKHGTKLSDIKEIFSHPQAIGQCSEFLKSLGKDVKITEVTNTALAAKMVSESNRTDIAAISHKGCAELYGLSAVNDKVANSDNNYTRFICISKNLEIYPGANKISLMFTLPHRPGALYSLIAKFSTLGINLSKIESRPIAGRDFEFMFYVDFETPIYTAGVINMLGQFDDEYDGGTFLGAYSEVN